MAPDDRPTLIDINDRAYPVKNRNPFEFRIPSIAEIMDKNGADFTRLLKQAKKLEIIDLALKRAAEGCIQGQLRAVAVEHDLLTVAVPGANDAMWLKMNANELIVSIGLTTGIELKRIKIKILPSLIQYGKQQER